MALPPDYDQDPGRFALARSVLARCGRAPDVHGRVARRLLDDGATPVLDIGCGDGELARHLPEGTWVGVDDSREMVARAPEPVRRGDAGALPFPDASFGSAALLYVLYHLDEPRHALLEARRVLRPGGLLAVALPSRHDSPELAHALPRKPLTADAESAGELLRGVFDEVEVESWDAPLLRLHSSRDVRDYLVGKGTAPGAAARASIGIATPLDVTKRGALLFARAPSR